MDELLVLVDCLMKLALVIGLMVLVATTPSANLASPSWWLAADPGAQRRQHSDEGGFDHGRTDDDDDAETSWVQPNFAAAVNVDGTPMCGDLDINGNPYGVIGSASIDDSHSWSSDWSSSDQSAIEWHCDANSDLTSENDWGSSSDFGCSTSSLFD